VPVYLSVDVVYLLGSEEVYIRKLKSTNPDKLLDGKHWFKEGQITRWTDTGFTASYQLVKTDKAIALRDKFGTNIELHETQVKTKPIGSNLDRYADLPDVLGE